MKQKIDNDTLQCVFDAMFLAGLTQSELAGKIHAKSLQTLTNPHPYIYIIDPETGPKRRPFVGDPSKLIDNLRQVNADNVPLDDDSDADRAVLFKNDKPIKKHQISYLIGNLFDTADIDAKPTDIVNLWQNKYINAVVDARNVILNVTNVHDDKLFDGEPDDWIMYVNRLISQNIHEEYNKSAPDLRGLVPDQLAQTLDDTLVASLENEHVIDNQYSSNIIRSSTGLITAIDTLLSRPAHKLTDVMSDAADRGNLFDIGVILAMVLAIYLPIQLIGLFMIGFTMDNIIKVIIVLVVYLNLITIDQSVDYPGQQWIDITTAGMVYDAISLSILRGEACEKIVKNIKSLWDHD